MNLEELKPFYLEVGAVGNYIEFDSVLEVDAWRKEHPGYVGILWTHHGHQVKEDVVRAEEQELLEEREMDPSVNLPTVPSVWEGNQFVDDRGSVSFVNEFNPFKCGVERFYTVRNVRSGYVRAWHGHRHEGKFAMVTSGMATIKTIRISDVEEFEKSTQFYPEILSFTLCSWQPKILWIPPGFYNGFKNLKPDTDVMFFSTEPLGASQGDDTRLAWDRFGAEVWAEDFR
jgi:dTDP-4-dehydrorhamnose 3,5-epimerase